MRMLFLGLLLVNAAFFAWEYRHPPLPAPIVASVEPGIPPVVLLRERDRHSTAEATPAPADHRQHPSSTPAAGAGGSAGSAVAPVPAEARPDAAPGAVSNPPSAAP